jgi:hypothetical protein
VLRRCGACSPCSTTRACAASTGPGAQGRAR